MNQPGSPHPPHPHSAAGPPWDRVACRVQWPDPLYFGFLAITVHAQEFLQSEKV